jgi:uncharacterized protein (TIGR02246 family)
LKNILFFCLDSYSPLALRLHLPFLGGNMIRFKTLSWLTAGLILLAGYSQAAPPTTGADEAAIRAQTTSWVTAYNGGDANAVAAQYANDAVLLPPGAPSVSGQAGILAFFTKDIADAKSAGVVLVIDPKTDVGVSGDMGWESGTFKVVIKGAVVESGKFLSVSRKKDGKWSYIRDTWNTDSAPVTPAQPVANK